MQIRPKKGITYKIQKTPKIPEIHQNMTEKRRKTRASDMSPVFLVPRSPLGPLMFPSC